MRWVEENKNKESITVLNQIIKALAESTDYDDVQKVMISSALVRSLFKARERLYEEGLTER